MMAIAQLSRFPQHARGKVDPVNAAGRPDCLAQERKIPSAAAAHVKDAVAAPESEALDRAPAQPRRNTEYPVEKRYDVGQTIVALADEITVAIHPLIRHALLPYSRASTSRHQSDSRASLSRLDSRRSLHHLALANYRRSKGGIEA